MTEPTHPMVLGGVRVMGGRFDEARPFLASANEMAAASPTISSPRSLRSSKRSPRSRPAEPGTARDLA